MFLPEGMISWVFLPEGMINRRADSGAIGIGPPNVLWQLLPIINNGIIGILGAVQPMVDAEAVLCVADIRLGGSQLEASDPKLT